MNTAERDQEELLSHLRFLTAGLAQMREHLNTRQDVPQAETRGYLLHIIGMLEGIPPRLAALLTRGNEPGHGEQGQDDDDGGALLSEGFQEGKHARFDRPAGTHFVGVGRLLYDELVREGVLAPPPHDTIVARRIAAAAQEQIAARARRVLAERADILALHVLHATFAGWVLEQPYYELLPAIPDLTTWPDRRAAQEVLPAAPVTHHDHETDRADTPPGGSERAP